MKLRGTLCALVIGLASLTSSFAEEPAPPVTEGRDVLEFVDGNRLVGDVVGEDEDFVTFRANGVTRAYPRSKVSSLARGAAPAPEAGDPAEEPVSKAKADDKAARKAREAAAKNAPLGPAALAWMNELIGRADTADVQVQRSVTAALTALGPGALEPLRKASTGAEGPRKRVLDRVVRTLSSKGDRKRAKTDAMPRGDRAAKRGRGGFERIATELELSDEQRPRMSKLLGDAYRSRATIIQQVRRNEIQPPAAETSLDALRDELVLAARDILDQGQLFLFEDMATRMYQLPGPGKRKAKK